MKFELGDWAWYTLERIDFLSKGKLSSYLEEMDFYKFLKRINDNTYIVNLSNNYRVNSTFNINDFSSFDIGTNLRTNSLQENNGR